MADDTEKTNRNRIFKRLDTNRDEKISAAELGEALNTLGSTASGEIKKMMAEVDTDRDRYISYQEYADFACANPGLMKDVAKIF